MSFTTEHVRQQLFWDQVRTQYEAIKQRAPEKVAGMDLKAFGAKYGHLIAAHVEQTAAHVGQELVNNPVLPAHEELHFERHVDQVAAILGFGSGGNFDAVVGDLIRKIRASARHVGDRLGHLVADVSEYNLDNSEALVQKFQVIGVMLMRGLMAGLAKKPASVDNVIDMLIRIEENMVVLHQTGAILSPGTRSRLKSTVAENPYQNGRDIKNHILDLTHVDSDGRKLFIAGAELFPVIVASRLRHQLSEAQFKAFYAILSGILAAAGRSDQKDETVPITYPREFSKRYDEIVDVDHTAYWRRLQQANLRGDYPYGVPKPPERSEAADIEGQGDEGPAAAFGGSSTMSAVGAAAVGDAAGVTNNMSSVLAMVQKDIASVTADKAAEKAFVAASQVAAFLKKTESSVSEQRVKAKRINAGVQRAARVNKFADDTKDMRGTIADLLHGKQATPTQFDVEKTLRSDFVTKVIEPHMEQVVPSSSDGGGTLIVLAPANVPSTTIDVWDKASTAERAQYFAAHLIKSNAGSVIHTADGAAYTLDSTRNLLIKEPLTEGAPRRALNIHVPIEKELAGGHTLVMLPISGELVSSRALMKTGAEAVDASAVDKAKEKAAAGARKVREALTKKVKKEIEVIDKTLQNDTPDKAELTKELDDVSAFIEAYKALKAKPNSGFSELQAKQLEDMIARRREIMARLRQVASRFVEQMAAKALVAASTSAIAVPAVSASLSSVSNEDLKKRWRDAKIEWNQAADEPHMTTYYRNLARGLTPIFNELMKRHLAVAEDFTFMTTTDNIPVNCATCGGKKKGGGKAAPKEDEDAPTDALLVECDTCGGKKKKEKGGDGGGEAAPADAQVGWPFKKAQNVRKTPTDYLVDLLGNNRDRTFFLSGGNGLYIGAGELLRTSDKLLAYLGNNVIVKYGLVKFYKITDETPELRFYTDQVSRQVKVGWGSDERTQEIFLVVPRNLGSYVYFELATTAKTPNDKLVWPALSGSTSLVVSGLPPLVPLKTTAAAAVAAAADVDADVGDDIDDILAEMAERSRKH